MQEEGKRRVLYLQGKTIGIVSWKYEKMCEDFPNPTGSHLRTSQQQFY